MIHKISPNDDELKYLRKCINTGKWNLVKNRTYESIQFELCIVENLVLHGTRIVILEGLRSHVPKLAHTGHPDIADMKRYLRKKYGGLVLTSK